MLDKRKRKKLGVEEIETKGLDHRSMCRFQPLFDGNYYVVFTYITPEGKEILSCRDGYGKEIPMKGYIVSSRQVILDGVSQTQKELTEEDELKAKGYMGFLGGNKEEK